MTVKVTILEEAERSCRICGTSVPPDVEICGKCKIAIERFIEGMRGFRR